MSRETFIEKSKGVVVGKPNNICTVNYQNWLVDLNEYQANELIQFLSCVSFLKGDGWRYSWLSATSISGDREITKASRRGCLLLKPLKFSSSRVFYLAFPNKYLKQISAYFLTPKQFDRDIIHEKLNAY